MVQCCAGLPSLDLLPMAPVDARAVGGLLDGELPSLAEAANVGRDTDAQVVLGQDGGHGATRPPPSIPRPPARPGGPRRAGRRTRGGHAAAVADARAAAGRPGHARPDRMARAGRRPAVGRGPDGDRPLLPQRQARGQARRRAHDVAHRQVGHGRRAVHLRGAPGGSRCRRPTWRRPGSRSSRRALCGCASCALSAAPGARGPVVRLLQQRLAADGYVVGQRGFYDARTARAVLAFRKVRGMARDLDRLARHVPPAARRRRALPHPPSRPRQARRGRPLAPGAGADPQREGRAHLPVQLGQAVDADGPRQLPRLLEDARDEPEGDGLLVLLHPRLRDPRLLLGARSSPPATAACGCRSPTRCRSSTGSPTGTSSTSTCSPAASSRPGSGRRASAASRRPRSSAPSARRR